MTYRYRIYTFKNGLDQTIFRAKRVSWLPAWATPWVWTYIGGLEGDSVVETGWINTQWTSHKAVMLSIRIDAESRFVSTRRAAEKKLKLIITEEESVEVTQ